MSDVACSVACAVTDNRVRIWQGAQCVYCNSWYCPLSQVQSCEAEHGCGQAIRHKHISASGSCNALYSCCRHRDRQGCHDYGHLSVYTMASYDRALAAWSALRIF
jgi:hypothetical protein